MEEEPSTKKLKISPPLLEHYINTGDLNGAYQYILQSRRYGPNKEEIREFSGRLDKKFLRRYQPDVDQVQEINKFLDMEGDQLWWYIETHNKEGILGWMKKYNYAIVHHPVTGKTIAHENYKLFKQLNLPNWMKISCSRDYSGIYAQVYYKNELD